MSFLENIKNNLSRTVDKLSIITDDSNMEKLNIQLRVKIINERFLPILKNNDFQLTIEDIESLNFPLNKLIMPLDLITGFSYEKPCFISNQEAMKDNKLLLNMLPIIRQIDYIYEYYAGHPPAKYLRMDTYMSDEEMQKFGLTNEQRNYYISILFNSKLTTNDVPEKLRTYMYNRKEEHKLVFKRKIPECFRKEVELFYLKFYLTNVKDYKTIQSIDNHIDNLEKELLNATEELQKYL